jgi:hypothetical protein
MNKIDVFINRLKKLGIIVEIFANYPWIYINTINGKRVTEKFQGNHGFTAFFLQIKGGVKVTDTREIFKLIRKYL